MPKRHLPSLHGLRAFESAGRHLSFSRAALELSVSQSAISHHIRQLEDELGTPLFIRRTRAVALTPAGTVLLAHASQALDLLATGTRAARETQRCQLRVSLLPSFAAHWLIPRLPRFQAAHPDIEIVLDPALVKADIGPGGVDLAIRYGQGDWPGSEAQLLLWEHLTPVCSPAYRTTLPTVLRPADLASCPRLTSRTRPPSDWDSWAGMAGTELHGPLHMLTDYNIVVQAALNSQGIAMGRLAMLADSLARGQLVSLMPDIAARGEIGYWLLTHGKRSPALTVFCDWLLAEAQQTTQRMSQIDT